MHGRLRRLWSSLTFEGLALGHWRDLREGLLGWLGSLGQAQFGAKSARFLALTALPCSALVGTTEWPLTMFDQ